MFTVVILFDFGGAFPGATIIGFDAKVPAGDLPSSCTLVQGSQGERADLERILAHADAIDIVIDDCSHVAMVESRALEKESDNTRMS